MKNFNTLEELREALMSEDGAVYNNCLRERFRLSDNYLERYLEKEKNMENRSGKQKPWIPLAS